MIIINGSADHQYKKIFYSIDAIAFLVINASNPVPQQLACLAPD